MEAIIFQFPHIPNVRCLFQYRSHVGLNEEQDSPTTLQDTWQMNSYIPTEQVLQQRSIFCTRYTIPAYAMLQQVHGTTVLFEPPPYTHYTQLQQADGMATSAIGLGLSIVTADCQSICFVHKTGKALLVLHVGWRANKTCFIQKAVTQFCSYYNIAVEDIFVVRGPSLSPERSSFSHFSEEWGEHFSAWYNEETRCMNLWELTRSQCIEVGIAESHIYGIDICTYSSLQYYSYRRNKTVGRQCTIVIRDY